MSTPDETSQQVLDICRRAQVASRVIATATRSVKDAALEAIAQALQNNADEICAANQVDVRREESNGMSPGLVDRLRLNPERVNAIADAVREVASLDDPVGEISLGRTLPNGLKLARYQVPMGVVGMIYEARPNVTVDAVALTLKSGNAVVLRGGSAALHSNTKLIDVIQSALTDCGLPADTAQSIDAYGREGARVLMGARGVVDVLIPRGGAGLIHEVVKNSTVPVIETGVGNCHVYIDRAANPDMARQIVLNSKTQRVGVCNAAETLLVHSDLVETLLPTLLGDLSDAGVTLHCDERAAVAAPQGATVVPATVDDWSTEYLSMDIAVAVVDNIEAAVDHIDQYSSGHTEAIVTDDLRASHDFVGRVDSAAVIINASTRFTDGGQFGLGAEIGISTQKLHSRGPMGLRDLTTTRWVLTGDGQVRT